MQADHTAKEIAGHLGRQTAAVESRERGEGSVRQFDAEGADVGSVRASRGVGGSVFRTPRTIGPTGTGCVAKTARTEPTRETSHLGAVRLDPVAVLFVEPYGEPAASLRRIDQRARPARPILVAQTDEDDVRLVPGDRGEESLAAEHVPSGGAAHRGGRGRQQRLIW
jgi:hypothetical protein